MAHAHVWYRIDGVESKVPVSFISEYNPTKVFDSKKLYKVFWSGIKDDTPGKLLERAQFIPVIESKEDKQYGEAGWYRANIFAIKDSLEELKADQSRRVRVPRDQCTNASFSADMQPNTTSDTSKPVDNKPEKKALGKSGTRQNLKDLRQKLMDAKSAADQSSHHKHHKAQRKQRTPRKSSTPKKTIQLGDSTSTDGDSDEKDLSYVSPRKFRELQVELKMKTQALQKSAFVNERLRQQLNPSETPGTSTDNAGGLTAKTAHSLVPTVTSLTSVVKSGGTDSGRDADCAEPMKMPENVGSFEENMNGGDSIISNNKGDNAGMDIDEHITDDSQDPPPVMPTPPQNFESIPSGIPHKHRRLTRTEKEKMKSEENEMKLTTLVPIPAEYNYSDVEEFDIGGKYKLSAEQMKELWKIPKGEVYDMEFIKTAAVFLFTTEVLYRSVAKGIKRKNQKYQALDPVGLEGLKVLLILRAKREGVQVKSTTVRTKTTAVSEAVNEKAKTLRRSAPPSSQ